MRHLCSCIAAVALLAGGALLLIHLIDADEIGIKMLAVAIVLLIIGVFALGEELMALLSGRKGQDDGHLTRH